MVSAILGIGACVLWYTLEGTGVTTVSNFRNYKETLLFDMIFVVVVNLLCRHAGFLPNLLRFAIASAVLQSRLSASL